MSAIRLALLAVLILGAGCPPGHGTRQPRPAGFNRWDAKARLDKALARSATLSGRQRAALRRDLGWLLLIHFGDAPRAEAQLRRAQREAGAAATPWIHAGLAVVRDLRLDVDGAADAWQRVLADLVRQRRGRFPGLPPPDGLSAHRLATLSARRLRQQLPHLKRPPTDEALTALRAGLPRTARAALSLALVGRARLRGDLRALRQREREAGCPTRLFLSRRYGRFGRTDLARPFGPDGPRPLPGQPVRAQGCSIELRSRSGAPGVRYLEAVVEARRAGPATVHVVWPRPFVLRADGRVIFGPEDRFAPRPRLREIPVTLRQGANRLRFKLPVFASPARLQLQVTPGQDPTAAQTARDRAPGGLYRPLADGLHIVDSLHRGQADSARGAALRLQREAPRFTWGQLQRARLEQADRHIGRRLGADRARAILTRALKRAPWAARLRLRLASALRRQGKADKALALVRDLDAATGLPGVRRLGALARIRIYRSQGWRALAFRQGQALARAHPGWLPAWKVYYLLALAEQSAASLLEAARRVRRLDATSSAWAQILALQGRHREAVAEARRLLGLRHDGGILRLLADELRLAGKPAAAAWQALHRRALWDTESRLGLANVLITAGQRQTALRLLRQGRAAHPEDADLGRALRALGNADPFAGQRQDGRAAVAAYRRAKWGAGKAPVYVLDRAVIRVFPSGGRQILTHQIVHLRTREDITRYAEVKLPPGVRVLTLRTLKQDGSIREPEDVAEKGSVSLSDVDEGDMIEVEYVSAEAAQTFWRPGGFFGTSFSFRSLAAHFFRSELVVITPVGQTLQHRAWGQVPTPVETVRGGLRLTRWTALRAARVLPEPLIPDLAGILPTVLVGARVRWSDYLRQRAELAYDSDVATHGIRRLARTLCQGKPAAVGARAAYSWVQKHVEESGQYYAAAGATLAARSGSRLTLLRALLRRCNAGRLETRLLRSRHRRLGRGTIPAVRLHAQPALWLRLPSGAVYLLPQLQQAPFGYLPPLLRQASALSVDRPGKRWRTPDQPDADARRITLSVILEPDGGAVILGHEKLCGLIALQLRAALRRVPARQLRQWLERAFFGQYFLGAVITRLTFKHQKRLDRPLEMIYRLSVPRMATPEKRPGGARRLVLRSGFYPALVGRVFGGLARRRLPLRLGPLGPVSLRLTLQLPAGFRPVELPRTLRLSTPFGRFHLQATARPGAVDLQRELWVPFRIVGPGQYARFTEFAARVDRAERVTVVLDKR